MSLWKQYSEKTRRRFANAAEISGVCCFYCGQQVWTAKDRDILFLNGSRAPVIDHMLPTKRGGTGDQYNLALSCSDCNLKKGAFTTEEYRMLAGMRGGSLNFVFPFERHEAPERDWICVQSREFEKELMVLNHPEAEERYRFLRGLTKPAN